MIFPLEIQIRQYAKMMFYVCLLIKLLKLVSHNLISWGWLHDPVPSDKDEILQSSTSYRWELITLDSHLKTALKRS